MSARQWSWVWEQELESVHFVSSAHMEAAYRAKQVELGPRFQIVFHGTEERSNVESILQGGFDPGRVRRRRRGFSPAWTSSSFDFFPSSGAAADTFRPRAFSAVSSSSPRARFERLEAEHKLQEVSSPDLGVDLMMESDMYSSLERGNTSRGKDWIAI